MRREKDASCTSKRDWCDGCVAASAAVRGTARHRAGGTVTRYLDERAFVLERWHCESEMELPLTPEHFVLLCALGDGKLTWEGGEMILRRGRLRILPAECERTNLCGQVDALLTWVE